jgi:predicted nucleic acid-binding protein
MEVNHVLDTNCAIYHLTDRLAESLPADGIAASIITEIELLSPQQMTAGEDARIREFLADITVVGLTPEVRDGTVRLRRAYRLKLPDAIIAATATALVLDAELLTNDTRLLSVPGLRARSVPLSDAH